MKPADLKERYRHRLAERITALGESLAAREEDADSLMRGFHTIAGLAGTIGFPAATVIALEGEQLCRLPAPDAIRLSAIVGRLRKAIA